MDNASQKQAIDKGAYISYTPSVSTCFCALSLSVSHSNVFLCNLTIHKHLLILAIYIYMEWNMIGTAAQYYKATLNVTTGLSAPYNNLAIIYKHQIYNTPKEESFTIEEINEVRDKFASFLTDSCL
ncbi:uncharacterized protein LOC104892984 [Beta vulgaris subsp. vulgaris]|uniref:uncharacterized protein LOC104892984 n=1 Tax=Beta vulgaris subsp. vulgaris TaxID=3555 RepID=UPI00053F6812|nr:uncharacterized protein LOC104892984 [Beta vulgaris subsp. vulgaris]XP_010677320.1 uncharacterized protein LOC104892984 [Beta vulgaris subsp. vulgaris]